MCFLSEKKGSDVILRYEAGTIDVAVIGAGHAGIEAALAAARLGAKTACFSAELLLSIENMYCR